MVILSFSPLFFDRIIFYHLSILVSPDNTTDLIGIHYLKLYKINALVLISSKLLRSLISLF